MILRQVNSRVSHTMACPTADHQDCARFGAGANKDMLRPLRAVDKIPFPKVAFLALDKQFALPSEDQKVLLVILSVIVAIRLAGIDYVDVDAVLLEAPVALEAAGLAKFSVIMPTGFLGVDDVPAVAFRNQTGIGLLNLRLWDRLVATMSHTNA